MVAHLIYQHPTSAVEPADHRAPYLLPQPFVPSLTPVDLFSMVPTRFLIDR